MSTDIDSPVSQAEIDAVKNAPEAPETPEPVEAESPPQETEKEPDEGADKPEKPPKDFVPHKAFHAEREQRKALQARLAQMEQESTHRAQLMEQRLHQIQQAWQQQNQPRPPEFDVDPIGNTKFELDQTKQELSRIKEWQSQVAQRQEQEFKQQQYLGQLAAEVSRAEAEYAAENPDYLEAVNHFKAVRAKQIEALGASPQEAMAHVHNEAFQIADMALRNGRNPAEVAHQMALAAGWHKKAAEPPAQEKMQTLQKGVKASSSLGSGGAQPSGLTIESLASMSDADFDAALKSGAWEKLGLG